MADVIQETLIDLKDDLQMAGQDATEKIDRPSLQSFRHQRVVGVAKDILANGPGMLELIALFIDENAHQLGNAQFRVSVV